MVLASRQASGGVDEVVWVLQGMGRNVKGLSAELSRLLPRAVVPWGAGGHAQSGGGGAQYAVPAYGHGDPFPAALPHVRRW